MAYNQPVRITQRTRIIQVQSSNLDSAQELMTRYTNSGNQQCILAMVKASYQCCCFDIKLDVPANYTVLEEDCGKSTGVMPSGAQWCYCCHKRIACMVTKNIVNYDAPVKSCPTKDNAYIDVDIHFTFKLP